MLRADNMQVVIPEYVGVGAGRPSWRRHDTYGPMITLPPISPPLLAARNQFRVCSGGRSSDWNFPRGVDVGPVDGTLRAHALRTSAIYLAVTGGEYYRGS